MPRSSKEIRSLFDKWALTYDDSVRQPCGPLEGYEHSLEEAAAMVPVEAGALLLDIGIGTGTFGALFADRGARVWGIDVSRQMLAECRLKHPGFSLAEGSFESIPYPDEQFDVVVSSFSFHEVPPAARGAAWAEAMRVLKPEGYVCLLDIMFASQEAVADARQALGCYWDDDEDYPLVGDLDALLRLSGLCDVRWRQTAPWHWAVVGRRLT